MSALTGFEGYKTCGLPNMAADDVLSIIGRHINVCIDRFLMLEGLCITWYDSLAWVAINVFTDRCSCYKTCGVPSMAADDVLSIIVWYIIVFIDRVSM